ncbi:T9SS type A sorting domain-containing protein [Seonamhaeicola sp. MEBiC1930]|uniref:T9SS type A sorting domain-containing protein n=1 Tax=Seonamhaeicola sp. MEBiC01930 TaxID=2976768 RepID=UPI00324D692D
MKKITLLCMLFVVSIGYAQIALPMDFEGSPVTGDFIDFDGGGATVKANPQSGGINTSATVVELIRNGGQVWAGSKIVLDSKLDFSTNKGLRMKVYTAAPIGTAVTLKIEDAANGAINVEIPGVTTVTNAWETIEYDFAGAASGTYDALVFLFDLGSTGDGTATSTFLFDDVEQFDNSGGLAQIDLPVDFEGSTTNFAVTDFGGNSSSLVVDPTDSGNMVIQSIKGAVSETWAGTTIGTAAGFATNIPISNSDSKMNIRVWSPDANTPVRLKIEDAADDTHTCETEVLTTSAGAWEVLEFDFSNEASGTATLANGIANGWIYNKASIFFDFGTANSNKTYYFDDLKFGEASLSIDSFEQTTFKAYPNPTRDSWTIKTQNKNIESIQVFDVLGKNVISLAVNGNQAAIDGSNLKTGLYFAQIKTDSGINSIKLIKQ